MDRGVTYGIVEIEDDDLGNEKSKKDDGIVEKVVEDKEKGKVNKEFSENKAKEAPLKKNPFSTPKEILFVPPPYEAKLTFPSIVKEQLQEKYRVLFDKQIKEIQVTMPLIDAFLLVPPYNKFLKDAIKEKGKELEGMVVLTHKCSAIIQRKIVARKCEDPGS